MTSKVKNRFSRNQNRQCLFSYKLYNIQFYFGQHLADIDEISSDRLRQVDGLMHIEEAKNENKKNINQESICFRNLPFFNFLFSSSPSCVNAAEFHKRQHRETLRCLLFFPCWHHVTFNHKLSTNQSKLICRWKTIFALRSLDNSRTTVNCFSYHALNETNNIFMNTEQCLKFNERKILKRRQRRSTFPV